MFTYLNEEIEAILERDPAARNKLEILLCYQGFHAVLLHRVAHVMWKKGWKLLARMLASFTRFWTGVEIHPAAQIGSRVFIDHGAGVVIGETAKIGDDVTLYHGVTLGGTALVQGIRHPSLEKGVIVGAGAKILGPINIGAFARIGSNAVVTNDVAENISVVGVPAHPINSKSSKEQKCDTEKFSAYATSGEDPLFNEMKSLRKEIFALQKRLASMEKRHDS